MFFNMISIAVIGCFKFWHPIYEVEYSNYTVTQYSNTQYSSIVQYSSSTLKFYLNIC